MNVTINNMFVMELIMDIRIKRKLIFNFVMAIISFSASAYYAHKGPHININNPFYNIVEKTTDCNK